MQVPFLSLVLMAMKGGSKKAKETDMEGEMDWADTDDISNEENELFDFPFLDEYASLKEEMESTFLRDDIISAEDDTESESEDDLKDTGEENAWVEMRQLYGDIEELLMRSMETKSGSMTEEADVRAYDEGIIGLPVKPGKEVVEPQGVISLQVTPQKSSEGKKGTIELPTKPQKPREAGTLKEIIELPTKPAPGDAAQKKEVIALSPGGIVKEGSTESAELEDKTEEADLIRPLSEIMAKRGVVKGTGERRKTSNGLSISNEELERLKQLQKQHREAVRKRLKEKEGPNFSWSELVDAKKKRLQRLKAIENKRKRKQTQKRKDKLHRLKDKDKEKRRVVHKIPIEKTVAPPEKKVEPPKISSILTEPEVKHPPIPETEEKKTGLGMAVPPKESFSAAPVVPGVTFANIKTCPGCGGFINVGVSNKCYSCGEVL